MRPVYYKVITLIFACIFMLLSVRSEASVQGFDIYQQFGKDDFEVELPGVILQDIESEITVTLSNEENIALLENQPVSIKVNDEIIEFIFHDGKATGTYIFTDERSISIGVGDFAYDEDIHPIPLWLSILPPLIAILMALIYREVYSALFVGLLVGTTIIFMYQDLSFVSFFQGLFAIIDTYILQALYDADHISIIIFSMLIGGMVSIVTRNGGMKGIVNAVSKYATTPRSGQLATWVMGIIIFFDDYANTLVVGNTMRSVTDKLKVSREKLSYIVDSTAAPVSAIAFVTTWIGAELGYIKNSIVNIPEISSNESVYSIFFHSLQYSFYPILTLIFIFILVMRGRDFGPMLKAERRARTTGQVSKPEVENEKQNDQIPENENIEPAANIKAKGFNAIIPVAIVIFGTLAGLIFTGMESCYQRITELGINLPDGSWSTVWEHLSELPKSPNGFFQKTGTIIGASDSYSSLLWSSLSALVAAIILTVSQRLMSLANTVNAAIGGFKSMLNAMLILILAWALAILSDNMHTADFLTGIIGDNISPWMVPALSFILSALVAFSTGSSWGTMAILYPLMLPSAWKVCQLAGMDYDTSMMIFYNVISTVLAGSVLGDHCSPISDTTILSSLASKCNHIDHVKTQLPYAITVGLVSVFIGTIPAAFGISPLIIFPVSIVVLYLVIQVFGKRPYSRS